MKQLLFLLLFPCFAMAQYQGNGNQKITLGEQTTADGLVYRGLAADTTRKPSVDTMAYILLDTNTNIIWQYKKSVNNAWTRVGGSISSGLTGVLPVENGGTNTSTLTANKVMVGNATSGVLTPTNLHWDNSTASLGIGTSSPAQKLTVIGNTQVSGQFTQGVNVADKITTYGAEFRSPGSSAQIFFGRSTSSVGSGAIGADANNTLVVWSIPSFSRLFVITQGGNVGIGTTTPQSGYRLHVVDSVYVGGNVSASAYTTRSDYDLKDEIQNISYGINEVMQMQPVKYTYKSNGSTQLGFIAQDIGVITPEVVSFDDKMSVYYNALIPILTKAIQEQQALIKALEQRILILENK